MDEEEEPVNAALKTSHEENAIHEISEAYFERDKYEDQGEEEVASDVANTEEAFDVETIENEQLLTEIEALDDVEIDAHKISEEFDVFEEEGIEESEDEKRSLVPKLQEIPIEIPNLCEDMPSLSELDGISKGATEYFYYSEGEEMSSEEEEGAEWQIGEEHRVEKLAMKKVEIAPLESDTELLMLLTREEPKEKQKQEKDILIEDVRQLSGIKNFLDNLIDEVVERSEIIDPDEILRLKLDRAKLMRAFKINITEIQLENKKRTILHRKMVDHFRRRKYTRALQDDRIETLHDNIKQYKQSLVILDRARGREKTLKAQLERKIEELSKMEDTLKVSSEKKLETLNKRLKEVALASTSSKTGQGISEKEARKLEDIGDDLKMIDYEALRAEAQELGDKLEEKNNELCKLRSRFNADSHFLAHIREKQAMLNQSILMQEQILRELKAELDDTRSYLSKLKLQRDSIRRKHNEQSNNCGLLDKPHLLQDYDITGEKITEMEARVENLKQNKKKILEELQTINKKLENAKK